MHLLNCRRRREESHSFFAGSARDSLPRLLQNSAEQFFGFLKKTPRRWDRRCRRRIRKTPGTRFSARRSGGSGSRPDTHVKSPMAITLKVFYALALDAEGRAGLRAGRNLDGCPAVEGWHFNFGPKAACPELTGTSQIRSSPSRLENFVGLRCAAQRRGFPETAAGAGLAVAGRTEARTGVHARRYAQPDFGTAFPLALSVACFTGFFHDASLPGNAGRSGQRPKMPREVSTCPRPPQVGHVRIFEPCSMPEPLQVSQRSIFDTAISFSQPSTASSRRFPGRNANIAALGLGGIEAAAKKIIKDGSAAENFAEDFKGVDENRRRIHRRGWPGRAHQTPRGRILSRRRRAFGDRPGLRRPRQFP